MLFSIIKNALSNASVTLSSIIDDQGSFFRVCYSQGGSELTERETSKLSTIWEPDNASVNGSMLFLRTSLLFSKRLHDFQSMLTYFQAQNAVDFSLIL